MWRWIQDPKCVDLSLDVASYLVDMKTFHQPTEKEYHDKMSGTAFLECFMALPLISVSVARAIDVYTPFSGDTYFQAEGLNFMIKHLRDWREETIDYMALAMNYLIVHGK